MGIMGNLAKMAGTLLAIFQTRVELFSVELQEGAQRLLLSLVLALVALFCFITAVFLAVLLVIVLFWDGYRLWAIGGLMVFFGAAAVLIGLGVRSRLRQGPGLLAFTRAEIAKDIERFTSGK
ncbi:MAG: phage holin family protein [Alistipes senegalensis]|nr:phage holin family protein [Oxalobacter formigenes]MCM1280380.1 phage holin family protein [Alistipes senegalensis]